MPMTTRKLLAFGAFVAVVLVAAAVGLMRPQRGVANPTSTPTPAAVVQSSPSPAPASSASPGQVAGRYVDYQMGLISKTPGTKILFFHAPWCPQCRKLEASILAGPIPAGVTIMKVDYDSNQKLRQQYGVTIQTTLVRVRDDSTLEERYVAYESPTLEALVKNLVP